MKNVPIECYKCYRLLADEHSFFDHECDENELEIEARLLKREKEPEIMSTGKLAIIASIFWSTILIIVKVVIS